MQRNEEEVVSRLQGSIRGFLARRKYQINHLENRQLESYDAFVVGNDPQMPAELNAHHQPKEKIALVATSGMRAVSLACKLGNPLNIPKIILVDNSLEVQKFWFAMRDFVENTHLAGSEHDFLKNLPKFLSENQQFYRNFEDEIFKEDCTADVKYLNQNISKYFKALFLKYGYEYVRQVISHTSLVKQSWADTELFVKLKNILTYLGISKVYMYPSNIVSCINNTEVQNTVLKNIEALSPTLTIHTNTCPRHRKPEQVILVECNAPAQVRLLFSQKQNCLAPLIPTPDAGFFDLNALFSLIRNQNGIKINTTVNAFGK